MISDLNKIYQLLHFSLRLLRTERSVRGTGEPPSHANELSIFYYQAYASLGLLILILQEVSTSIVKKDHVRLIRLQQYLCIPPNLYSVISNIEDIFDTLEKRRRYLNVNADIVPVKSSDIQDLNIRSLSWPSWIDRMKAFNLNDPNEVVAVLDFLNLHKPL